MVDLPPITHRANSATRNQPDAHSTTSSRLQERTRPKHAHRHSASPSTSIKNTTTSLRNTNNSNSTRHASSLKHRVTSSSSTPSLLKQRQRVSLGSFRNGTKNHINSSALNGIAVSSHKPLKQI